MSLSRLALRLAVVEMLAPVDHLSSSDPRWPTLAPGDRVFDSQIGTEPVTEEARRAPMISVYTDDAKVESASGEIVYFTDGLERCTLAFEIIVPGVVQMDNGMDVLVPVETDALAEALVDTIGSQIYSVLQAARLNGPLRHVLHSIEKIESRPWRDADSDVRLSARRDEYEVRLVRCTDFEAGKTGLDRLPQPLRNVALELAAGGYGRVLAETVAAALVDPAILPQLAELRLAGLINRSPSVPPASASGTAPTGDVVGSITYP